MYILIALHNISRFLDAQRYMIANVIVLSTAAILPALAQQPLHYTTTNRNFVFYNDTSRLVSLLQVSSESENSWHTVTDAIPPHSHSHVRFGRSGPCVVHVKLQFNKDPQQEVSWNDGFDLCTATHLHLTHEDDGNYYIRPTDK
jgi:hypothetical protein